MLLFATLLSSCAFIITADALTGFKSEIKEPFSYVDFPIRDKRTLGVDKNIKKEIELKTKLGTVLKLSKTITYNDGGGLNLLPALLDSITANKKSLLSELKAKQRPLPPVRDPVLGAGSPGLGPKSPLLQKKASFLAKKKALLYSHKKALKLKKILLIKKISDAVRAMARTKEIGAPCCPTGPCCPGKQG